MREIEEGRERDKRRERMRARERVMGLKDESCVIRKSRAAIFIPLLTCSSHNYYNIRC